MSLSPAAERLKQHLKAYGIAYEEEYRFNPIRKWRADFMIPLRRNIAIVTPDYCILVEIDGGNRMAKMINGRPVAIGRHTLKGDYEKLNSAVLLGYRVLRFTPAMVTSGEAVDTIRKALE